MSSSSAVPRSWRRVSSGRAIALLLFGTLIGAIGCGGGGARAVAAALGAALDVTFDNGPSGLAATNVQAALDEVEARIDALEPLSGSGGSVFTRWGNTTAPAGTTLIYSGRAFGGSASTSSGGAKLPVVVQSGDPGSSDPNGVSTLKPTQVFGGAILNTVDMMAGTSEVGLVGAVCWAPRPTAMVWGTHTPPAGWTVLYKGYAFSGHQTVAGSVNDMICIDTDAFDASVPPVQAVGRASVHPVTLNAENAPTYGHNTYLKCALVMKEP